MEEKQIFKQGDFIKRDNRKGSFMIYEGNNISDTCVKKLTLVCAYEPEKYMRTSNGEYGHIPNLEVAYKTKRCSETIDTEKEDFWIKLCTPQEKLAAIKVLEEYGYVWDEKEMAMIDITTGEIIKRIVVPDNTYHGETIKPIGAVGKAILKSYCLNKSKKEEEVRYAPGFGYSEYDDYGD